MTIFNFVLIVVLTISQQSDSMIVGFYSNMKNKHFERKKRNVRSLTLCLLEHNTTNVPMSFIYNYYSPDRKMSHVRMSKALNVLTVVSKYTCMLPTSFWQVHSIWAPWIVRITHQPPFCKETAYYLRTERVHASEDLSGITTEKKGGRKWVFNAQSTMTGWNSNNNWR